MKIFLLVLGLILFVAYLFKLRLSIEIISFSIPSWITHLAKLYINRNGIKYRATFYITESKTAVDSSELHEITFKVREGESELGEFSYWSVYKYPNIIQTTLIDIKPVV